MITSAAAHPSSPLIIVCSADRSVRLFDADERRVVSKRPLRAPATCAALSQWSNCAVAGLKDGTVLFLTVPSLHEDAAIRSGRLPWRFAAFAPGGRHLAVGSAASLLVLSREEGMWRVCGKAAANVSAVDWSDDGRMVCTCGEDLVR